VLRGLLFHNDPQDVPDLPLHWNQLAGIHHVVMWLLLRNLLLQQRTIPQMGMEMMGMMKLVRNSRI
jgi:hypothetical protein